MLKIHFLGKMEPISSFWPLKKGLSPKVDIIELKTKGQNCKNLNRNYELKGHKYCFKNRRDSDKPGGLPAGLMHFFHKRKLR